MYSENDFVFTNSGSINLETGSFTWKSPSNIALIKYWGKTEPQIPKNPSISFTLQNCHTTTRLSFTKKNISSQESHIEVYFEKKLKLDFKPKIKVFFERIRKYVAFISDYNFKIETENSFPHSSGIASSASGMSALALCIMSMEREINSTISQEFLLKKASFLARLGSGSASRSIEGPVIVWGEHSAIRNSSKLFGTCFPFELHKNFENYHDLILLVDIGEKKVSSTIGHDLMHDHPFASERFNQANRNLTKMSKILQNGDLKSFVKIVESEALTLHAMMMTSEPNFVLMKPNTLKIIEKIWAYRDANSSNICFTLDAGANIHLLIPESEFETAHNFVKNELVEFCENKQFISDCLGNGAQKIN